MMKMIALDNHPFFVVEVVGFPQLIQNLEAAASTDPNKVCTLLLNLTLRLIIYISTE